jgi:hypothetical protein
MSEPEPSLKKFSQALLTPIVGSTFESVVLSPDKDVFMVLYNN